MTQAQKLEALIQKAIESGFNDPLGVEDDVLGICNGRLGTENFDHWYPLEGTLFNKDFARALFGEKMIGDNTTTSYADPSYPTYLYHLQQAVISEDPIGYYYEQVFGK